MIDLRNVVDRLRNPVGMPGVQRTVSDELADQYPELVFALAGLLEFEQELVGQVPRSEVLRRSSYLEDIAEILSRVR